VALITNNISGSSSNASKIGVTGSVIIANQPDATFPPIGTDVVFFVSGSTGGVDKSVFGGDMVVSGAVSLFGDTLQMTGSILVSGNINLDGVFRGGYKTFAVNDYAHVEGTTTFAADVYTVILSTNTLDNALEVIDASLFNVGDRIAYVYNASGNNNFVHITDVTSVDLMLNAVTASNVVSINSSAFNALALSTGISSSYNPIGTISIEPPTVGKSILINLSAVNNTQTFAHAEGSYTMAIGVNSHAEGRKSMAVGSHSHAEGAGTLAYDDGCHAEGIFSRATGYSSHAEGSYTIAEGDYSHAEGYGTLTNGSYAHAEGSYTIAEGDYSHAEGYNTTASGNFGSHAEGSGTTASGSRSHAEGNSTTASGTNSHAEGNGSVASDENSHAEGNDTLANNFAAHAEGNQTKATGYAAHAEGDISEATGDTSHAEGVSFARGDYSHSEGFSTIASGTYSHVGGLETIASGTAQTVIGQYNLRDNNFSLFVVGNGTADDNANRSDVFRVNQSDVQMTGSVLQRNSGVSTIGIMGNDAGVATTRGTDVFLFVSGTIGSRDTTTRGTSLFGGDMVISGTLAAAGDILEVTGSVKATLGLSGSLTRLTDGTSYLKAGTNISVTTGSNGSVTITNTFVQVDDFFDSTTAGSAYTTGSFAFRGQESIDSPIDKGNDVFFYVSGSKASQGTSTVGVALFGGDLVVSGNLIAQGDTLEMSGTLKVTEGISGSLTKLDDGTSYLIAGTNMSIVTGSNGAVTISNVFVQTEDFFDSTTAGSVYTTGSFAFRGLESIDSPIDKGSDVFFYVSGSGATKGTSTAGVALFGGDVVISGTLYGGSPLKIGSELQITAGLSGSLTKLTDGTSYLIAGTNISVVTGSNGSVTISNTFTQVDDFFDSSTAGALYTTGSVAFRGNETSVNSPDDKGPDVFFYVSGSIGGTGVDDKKALFGGDVVISGSLSLGSGVDLPTGIVNLDGGNPGSATVTNSLVKTTSMIFLTKQANTNTTAGPPVVSAKSAGTFTITTNFNGDADPVAFLIINPSNS